ncbi:probable ATP-dependent RNA helicase DDX20 [Antedon mediterranea]|uniref:probable ATP-dependent RNA helicase DDX20 n=1 Tax=Antedon mediterranea TaxID=105859 RepID=UPI003AF58AE4
MNTGMKTAHDITIRPRTDDVLNEENSNVDFASLLLSRPVLEGLQRTGFHRPSPIQLKAIPLGRCGLDLIIQAKSGTGKTCVFSVIALESLDMSSNALQVLILAPTREIAVQIQQVILDIGQVMEKLKCHVFIGGTLIGPDKQNLKKCHIAVGTPGRVKQLIETGLMVPDSIRLFILDEADKLLDDKFQSQINWIYNELPYSKQIVAASATYPEYLAQHLTTYMRDATFVRLNPKEIALHGIRQYYKLVESHDLPHKSFALKVNDLIDLLSNVTFQQCLIFSNLHTRAENLCDILCQKGWPSMFISGGLEQKQRLHAMSTFKKFECRVLISTDLTARGIDAEKVNLVINLDVPVDVKTYMHRIGRAGRFGTYGASITLASFGREELLLHSIQKECHVPIRPLPDPVPSDLLSPNVGVAAIKTDGASTTTQKCVEKAVTLKQLSTTSKGSASPSRIISEDSATSFNGHDSFLANDTMIHLDKIRSNTGAIRKISTLQKVMLDKGCQTIDPNSVFSIITSEIPSLKETLGLRRSPKWSFADAVKDFRHFLSTGEIGNTVIENTSCNSYIKNNDYSELQEANSKKSIILEHCDIETNENQSEEINLNDNFHIMNETTENNLFVEESPGPCLLQKEYREDKIEECMLPLEEQTYKANLTLLNKEKTKSFSKESVIPYVCSEFNSSVYETEQSDQLFHSIKLKETTDNTIVEKEPKADFCQKNVDADNISRMSVDSTGNTVFRRKEEEIEILDEESELKWEEQSVETSIDVESHYSDQQSTNITDDGTSEKDECFEEGDKSESDIFIVKDGVVVQIGAKYSKLSSEQRKEKSENSEVKTYYQMSETNGTSIDEDENKEMLRNKRKQRRKKNTKLTDDGICDTSAYYDYYNNMYPLYNNNSNMDSYSYGYSGDPHISHDYAYGYSGDPHTSHDRSHDYNLSYYNNSSYYNYSDYQSYYNYDNSGSFQHQMSHMGQYYGSPFYNTNWWYTGPYYWNAPYWHLYNSFYQNPYDPHS